MTLAISRPLHRLAAAAAAGTTFVLFAACGDEPPPPPKASARPPVNTAAPAAVPKAPADAPRVAASGSEGDQVLARRVKDALLARPDLKAHGIDISARDGLVTLFGTADNAANRRLAGELAAAVEGVKSVDNRLVIASGS